MLAAGSSPAGPTMKKIFVNGTFDILHIGHLKILQHAKSLGDYLLVAIDTDERVKKLKGNDRPINTEEERMAMLESIRWVDEVQLFHTDEELLDLIASCDIMVKGSDYRGKSVIGSNIIDIEYYDRTEHSTTKKIQYIVNR